MPLAAEATPALALLVVVVWEVHCTRADIPNRHRGLLCCLATSVWAAYYAIVGIRDFANQHHAIAIVALGLAVMTGSLARTALKLASDEELPAEESTDEVELVGAGFEA